MLHTLFCYRLSRYLLWMLFMHQPSKWREFSLHIRCYALTLLRCCLSDVHRFWVSRAHSRAFCLPKSMYICTCMLFSICIRHIHQTALISFMLSSHFFRLILQASLGAVALARPKAVESANKNENSTLTFSFTMSQTHFRTVQTQHSSIVVQ